MRKIKKFKIPIYHFDIYRKAKKMKIDVDGSKFGGQEGLKQFTTSLASEIETSTVFEYFKNDSPLWGSFRTEGKTTAVTAGIITLGETFTGKTTSLSDPEEKTVAEIAAFIFISTGANVVSEFVNEEAKNEGFELLKPVYLYSNPPSSIFEEDKKETEKCPESLLLELAEKLEAEKIGVKDENGLITPPYTAFFFIPWAAKKKK